MSLLDTFSLSIKNILSSKMRTFLTMLGIIIGVAAVIIITGLGNGMAAYMEAQFASLGTDTLTVRIRGRGATRSVSVDDMYEIVDKNPTYLKGMSPRVSMTGTVKIGTETYSETSATGVSEQYFEMKNLTVAKGRGLTYIDIRDRNPVCVVGAYIEQELYGGSALGQTLRIGTHRLTIVGVLEQESDSMEEGGSDDCVYLPYTAAARMSGTGTINSFSVQITDKDLATEAKTAVETALYKIFKDKDAYSVVAVSEMLDMMNSMLSVVITILTVIAAISLLVGGIGIMNIMLVSVTERTREIGIRKALGARERTILSQFVIEAGITSALGGVLGILIGFVISAIASRIIPIALGEDMAVTPDAVSVLIAFGVSVGIGVLFGYLPAKKAAELNPIDALHYD